MRSFWLAAASFALSTGIAFAQTTPSTTPSAGAMGNMVPSGGAPASTPHYTGTGTTGTTAAMYLHMAKVAVGKGNKAAADEYLSRAETRMLSRAVPSSEANQPINTPGIAAVRSARADIKAGNMTQANTDIDTAMNELHGNPTYNNGMGTSNMAPSGMSQ
jgi:hypothetical protein